MKSLKLNSSVSIYQKRIPFLNVRAREHINSLVDLDVMVMVNAINKRKLDFRSKLEFWNISLCFCIFGSGDHFVLYIFNSSRSCDTRSVATLNIKLKYFTQVHNDFDFDSDFDSVEDTQLHASADRWIVTANANASATGSRYARCLCMYLSVSSP